MQDQTTQRAVAVIIRKDRVLLIHRIKGDEDYYVLPGGGIETGEQPVMAVAREVKEELGLDVTDSEFLFELNTNQQEYYFLCRTPDDQEPKKRAELAENKPDNQHALVWVAISEFNKINFLPELGKQRLNQVLLNSYAQN